MINCYSRTALKAAFLLATMLLMFACTFGAQPTLVPPPAPSFTATPLPSPTLNATATPSPAPTLDAFSVFAQNLKSVIEQNDDAALRPLIAPTWSNGRYRSDVITQVTNVADAVAAFRAMRQGATITLDLQHVIPQAATTQPLGERVIVARWVANGREELAYFYVSPFNGDWRWTALLRGVPTDQVLTLPTVAPTVAPIVVATTSPAVASGHLVFMRGSNVLVRDLSNNTDTLVADVGDSSQWDWTRDGLRAVFVRGVGADGEIWTINRDGSGPRRLTNDNVADGSPRWSPDGTQIVYEHNVQAIEGTDFKVKGEIWLMNADGSNKRKLANGYDPAWAPDGQRLAFASNALTVKGGPALWESYARNGIHLINAQGRNEWAPISTDTPSGKFTPLGWQMSATRLLDRPQWSPDGKEITLRAHGGHSVYITTNTSAGGLGKFIALFFEGMANGFSYSPNGNYFTLNTGGQSGVGTIGIFRRSDIGRDGVGDASLRTLGKIPRAANEVAQSVVGFAWSPDSTRVVYALHTVQVMMMDVANGESKLLIADGTGPVFWIP